MRVLGNSGKLGMETPQMTAGNVEEMGYEGKQDSQTRTIHFGFMGPNQTTYLKVCLSLSWK